ncbi:MAG: hypothetical protein ABI720_00970 [Actinomycetes bacterium]
MTVVYHVESHRNPRQIERLVGALVRGAPDALVIVDHDRAFAAPDASVLAQLGAVLRLSDGGYGDMSHVNRWFATARWLRAEGIEFSYLSNLTGQDFPLRPMADIHADLQSSGVDAFVQTFEVFDEGASKWGVARGRTRYEFSHRRIRRLTPRQQRLVRPLQAFNVVQPWARVTTSTGLAWGRRVSSPWSADLVLRGGSFFCTLSCTAVEAVLRFADELPEVAEHLSGSIAPDEVYLQTALGWARDHDPDSRQLVIANDCRRYFDFSESTFNHPKLLTVDDLPRALSSGADFARKFDEEQYPGVLDALEGRLNEAHGSYGQRMMVEH